MKVTFITLALATIALANPAPLAAPDAAPAPVAQPVAQPIAVAPVEARSPKKSKTSSSSGNNTEAAADMITPSRALQLGALGLGVMEVVRLWG